MNSAWSDEVGGVLDIIRGVATINSFFLQSVRLELMEKEERDNTGLEALLEGSQESYFLSGGGGEKAIGTNGKVM